ncbi:MAG: PQQ-like beta-propeller repeat protein [Chitinispirillales bacterium]|jgi:outer membrane protein assembly factor BamB|nr:PQQ-like beta-propeller repeat protein [Chitinispirillales bacterium]
MKYDKKTVGQIVKGVQWSSGIAIMVIGVLLAATLIQIKIHDPVNNQSLSNLMQRLERDPSNQNLKEDIRALDLLARKAYFTSAHQLRTGSAILLAALAIFLIMWKINAAIFSTQAAPPVKKLSWWQLQTRSAKTVAFAGGFFVTAAIFSSVLLKYTFTSSNSPGQAADYVDESLSQWANFRGPQGIGIASGDAPVDFDAASMEGIRWKVKVPLEGNSSPVVYDDRIFLTGGTKDARQVFCFDVSNGKLLWSYNVKVGGSEDQPLPKVDRETGFAAPTVACDGKRVYAIFATGELVSLTVKGKHVWSRFLGAPDNHYGHSSSLIAGGGLLFVQLDEYDKGKLLAINGKTGKTVWEVPRTILSWGSPILVNTGSRRELILVDNETVTSYDPVSGKLLWSKDCLYGEVGPSAAFSSGKVFVANEYAAAAGIDLVNLGDDGLPPVLWEWRGALPSTASPVSIDTLLFLATAGGTLTCIDNRTGTTLWEHEFDQGFYSSPVVAAGHVFLTDRNGVMHIFTVSDEQYSHVASREFGEPIVTTPAILDGYMVVRGEKFLYRVDGR